MRGTELDAFGVFWGGATVAVLFLLSTKVLEGCDIES